MGNRQRYKRRNIKSLYKRRGERLQVIKKTKATELLNVVEVTSNNKEIRLNTTELPYISEAIQIIPVDEQNTSTSTELSYILEDLQKTPNYENNTSNNVIGDLEILETQNGEDNPTAKEPIGRRIVNISIFFKQLQELSNHGPFQCGLSSVELVSEVRKGLISKFKFKCKLCNLTSYIESDNTPDEMNLNTCAVAGAVATGSGYTQLTEITSTLGLPTMSLNVYEKHMALINEKWEIEALKSMHVAAEEERRIAIEEGNVSSEGIPIIDVIADGCWGKRSYKKNYSSLSGAAAIIGRRTQKILFMAVKNKYCCICAQAENRRIAVKDHICYKNYAGSSTGMESTIIIEGFKKSIEMHNLIYGRLISDGDANTYAKLLQQRPYDKLKISIEKIECRNHLLRNLCNKLQSLTTDTKYLIKYRKYLTKKRILSIRKVIVSAIRKYKGTDNIMALYDDTLLAAEHAFGIHTLCKEYFCSKIGEDENIERELFTNTIWHRIKIILTHIAGHARSLIHDVDSNTVERYHNIVAKYVGGKRVNFSQKYQYQMRCNAAALSFNTQKPIYLLHKSITGNSPSGEIKRNMQNKLKRLQLSKKYCRRKKRYFDKQEESAMNYGENCLQPDMCDYVLEKSKKEFLKNLEKSPAEIHRITRETVLQSGCSEWMELRRSLLTASNFGRVIKKRMDISCANMVKDFIYKDSIDHVTSIKHGKENESIARVQLEKQEKIEIKSCGLYIDEEIPYLGASPDGIINDDMCVEIKCPISAYKIGLEKAIDEKKITFYKKKLNGCLEINKGHNWFYQIQGQLHVTKMSKCLLGIWYGEKFPIKTHYIEKDDEFWAKNMKDKLMTFYIDCMLPELVDPRHTRKMKIRDPKYITDAIELKKKKKEDKENKIRKRKRKTDCQQEEKINGRTMQQNCIIPNKIICQRRLDFKEF